MTEQHRTVAAERDLPRVRQWIDDAVRHAVNEAAQALNAIRYWCDHSERELEDAKQANDEDYDDVEDEVTRACRNLVKQVRALLPVVPEATNRRAETGEEVTSDGHSSDASRSGHVTPDP
jgi:hypothetical protein